MRNKILFIITKSETGGAQKFVAEQIIALYQTNDWNCLIATNQDGWLTKSVSQYITSSFVDKRIENRFSFTYITNLIQFIKREQPDIIIANSANGGLYGRIAGILTATKVIYVSHGWSSIYNGGRLKEVFNFVEHILSHLSASILCISETDKLKAIQNINIPVNKIQTIPNSIFPIKSDRTFLKADFVTVCRLIPPKRVDLLIDAMSLLPYYSLDVVGDGYLLPELKKKANQKQLKNINFLGEIPGFQGFSNYKAFCLISDSEGMPMSALEAMSCGLPLILSDVGGCKELIYNNGILVSNNSDEIANALKYVVTNSHNLAIASTQLFHSKFNLNNTITNYSKYYQDTLLSGSNI